MHGTTFNGRLPPFSMSSSKDGKEKKNGGEGGNVNKEKKKETESEKLNKDREFQAAAAMTTQVANEPGRRRKPAGR